MGVKTIITLEKLNTLFTSYNFIKISSTTTGIMDTTYIVFTKQNSYILKHYERDIENKIIKDAKLLDELKSNSLNVSRLLDSYNGWYIYERLLGDEPKNIKTFHIQALARFLSKMHKLTYKKSLDSNFINYQELNMMLTYLKRKNYINYKKFINLKDIGYKNDGIIHGDIFKDNTVFYNSTIGVFDFSDSGDGSFIFDAGITLFGFKISIKKQLYLNLFLNSYNQRAKKRFTKKDLLEAMKIASDFYGLKRVFRYNLTHEKFNNQSIKF